MTPDVQNILDKLDRGEPLETRQIDLIACQIAGKHVTFCVDFERDPIQRHHRRGKFYERPELEHLRGVVKPKAVILDIGANTGNHTLFFAMHLDAARVIPIEPNPQVYRLLIANVLVNGLRELVELGFLGVGLSDAAAEGFAMEQRRANLGAARMIPDQGDIATHTGDALFAGIAPDFIKIDVEGMEMQVLSGLETIIAAHQPVLLVEVDKANDTLFKAWAESRGYGIDQTWSRYEANNNYLLSKRM
ncbi:FkbM family methyltransferase [Silicimonas sp. MF1-12-2]|uniref:FkbM family methyltransferase n=1 Tax=Silicimonas sp. MF1-12-2 TaxID=3384793 RepID=UPI0039B36FEC